MMASFDPVLRYTDNMRVHCRTKYFPTLEMMESKEWSSLCVKYCHIGIYDVNISKSHVDQWLFTVLCIPYTLTEQFTGSYVNLHVNSHTHRSYNLFQVHCPVKKQHTVLFFWYLFWPEISLAKIMYGNMMPNSFICTKFGLFWRRFWHSHSKTWMQNAGMFCVKVMWGNSNPCSYLCTMSWRQMWEWNKSSIILTWAMVGSGKIHTPATLCPGRDIPLWTKVIWPTMGTKWQALTNIVLNLWVPHKVENFL